jgi:hypothetical protein
MAQAEVKSFDSPDETRPFEGKGKAEVVELAGRTVLRSTYEAGWRWSNNVKPIAKTDSCQVFHIGYCISGRMKVFMDDGTELEVGPGEVCVIPPGHDAEVVSDGGAQFVDFGEVSAFEASSNGSGLVRLEMAVGAVALLAWSRMVPKIESVPS